MSDYASLIRPALLLAAVLLLNGCGLGHLWHLAKGQADLLRQRRPVHEALQDARLSGAQRDKIRLVLKVRAFGIERLGLHDSATYTTFVHLDRPFVSYNLTASPVDAIEPYVWRYPVVGRMPYQGFFSKDSALAAQRELQQRGYDTYLRGIRAYSTLGYFADPILSSMLSYPDGALIETVLHEMLHQTVWIKGHVSFNESLASFVGQKGAEAYLAHHDGADSPAYRDYLDRRADAALLRTHLQQLIARLQDLYQEPVSQAEKLRRRETAVRRSRRHLAGALSAHENRRLSPLLRGPDPQQRRAAVLPRLQSRHRLLRRHPRRPRRRSAPYHRLFQDPARSGSPRRLPHAVRCAGLACRGGSQGVSNLQ